MSSFLVMSNLPVVQGLVLGRGQTVSKLTAVLLLFSVAYAAKAFDPSQQDDSQAVVRHFSAGEKGANPLPAFDERRYEPVAGETVALIGGTQMMELAEDGVFEALLHQAHPNSGLKVRSIAWSADTVHRQQRPMFFYTKEGDTREGSVPDLREKLTSGTFVLMFGKMESLDGESGLKAFVSDYRALLNELAKLSPRIVLVAPVPFSTVGPAAEEAEARNVVLQKYSAAIGELAGEGGFAFVDPSSLDGGWREEWSRDGLLLNGEGRQKLAGVLAMQMGGSAGATVEPEVLAAVKRKNLLWEQYFRPTNWAFLFGDRQNVPSSRDHLNSDKRWFVEELQGLPKLIDAADKTIAKEVSK